MTVQNVSDTNEMAGLVFVESDHCYRYRSCPSERWVHLPESMTDQISQETDLIELGRKLISNGYVVTGAWLLQQMGLNTAS